MSDLDKTRVGIKSPNGRVVETTMAGMRKVNAAEQTHLPGMEPITIPEVETAARAFADAKQDHEDAGTIRKNCEETLIRKMKAHEIRFYKGHGLKVTVDTKESAKVKRYQEQAKPKGTKEAKEE